MARKVFVSYKYGDDQVKALTDGLFDNTKVRDYIDILQDSLNGEDEINKGEADGEDMSGFKDSTIESKLREKLGLSGYSLPVIPIPSFVLKILLRLAGKSNFNPCSVYSCQKILTAGLRKTNSLEQGLSEFVDWYIHCSLEQRSF